ncbi:MAG: dihydrodipicolinate synthase family protein [Proteobacteria bacterium]|nr:dihydrodipicolinate synthase family protein [Pseudomonadota bacterium]
MKANWQGVFPAATTQFDGEYRVDLAATRRVIETLIRDGADGLIVCGTVGEGTSLSAEEKRAVLEAAREVANRRVPVLAGVAEYTTELACRLARDAKRIGLDGLMVLPAMVYGGKPRETLAHFRTVAAATDLPIMLYNNPPAYRTDVTPAMVASLADVDTIVSIKESSGDTRRFTDIRNAIGDRFILFCGLDDVVLEAVMLGCVGWVSGMSNVFPQEGNRLFALARAGQWAEARRLYDWFMPLLHLDARSDLVQCIKLCEQIAGRGSERTRPPRLLLEGAERAEVEAVMRAALSRRPNLAKVA